MAVLHRFYCKLYQNAGVTRRGFTSLFCPQCGVIAGNCRRKSKSPLFPELGRGYKWLVYYDYGDDLTCIRPTNQPIRWLQYTYIKNKLSPPHTHTFPVFCMLWCYDVCIFVLKSTFSKICFSFTTRYQSVFRIQTRPDFWRVWCGHKLYAKVISRQKRWVKKGYDSLLCYD